MTSVKFNHKNMMTIPEQLKELPEGVHVLTIQKDNHFDNLFIECSDSEGERMYHAYNDEISYCPVRICSFDVMIGTEKGLKHFDGIMVKFIPHTNITITKLPTFHTNKKIH